MYGFWVFLFAIGPLLLILGVAFLAVWAFLRHRNLKWPWRVLLWVGGPVAVLLVPSLLNIMVHVKAYSAKEGRVIDTATGKGIPNVAVIAVDTYIGKNNGGEYREIVYTNMSGDYRIPDHWGEVVWWMPPIPIALPEIRWTVTAFQPGYAVVGDESAWQFNEYGQPLSWPRSISSSPSSTWWGRTHVEPIKMKPVHLGLKESATYAHRLLLRGVDYSNQHDPKEEALRRTVRDIFLPQVCAMDPEATMDMELGGDLADFGEDYLDSSRRLGQLEPSGFKDAYLHPVFHAKNVCEAMRLKAGEYHEAPHSIAPLIQKPSICSYVSPLVTVQGSPGAYAYLHGTFHCHELPPAAGPWAQITEAMIPNAGPAFGRSGNPAYPFSGATTYGPATRTGETRNGAKATAADPQRVSVGKF